MFVLGFDEADEQDVTRYTTCYTSLAASARAPQMDEWDDVIALMKKLKGVGRDSGTRLQNGAAMYRLNEGAATVRLERSEHKALINFINQPMWLPAALESARECKLWLESLKPEEPSVNA